MQRYFWKTFICLLLPILVASRAFGQAHGTSSDAALSAKKLEVAPGLKVDLFASEPLLVNPVAFSIDEKGRFFIAETHRYKDAIFDITQKTNWLLDDLSFKTVEDRSAFLHKTFTNLAVVTNQSELIRLVEDRDGDGRAETSSIFADGFREPVSGTAAGILAQHGQVWFTCIPDLWKFTEEGGKAKTREALHSGYGVHIGVTGHDLHGLRMGPDGKLYFSSGDRGFAVRTKEGKILNYPNTGGVLRCNPDGTQLEVFCIGLRNPQDLVFDEYGNLWTDDNDTAGPDESRLLHLVEGADYGWRNSYQYAPGYGPWCKEELWKGGVDGILPPVGLVAKGPAGLAFYPGTGLPEKYTNHFFACDFPQGVWSFTIKPKGASFELANKEHFLWHLGPTKVEFGPDSDVYVSDWGQQYPMPNAGKIYRVFDPAQKESAKRAEVKKLLADGMSRLSVDELAKLLGHSDLRVRLEAQFELSKRAARAMFAQYYNSEVLNLMKDRVPNVPLDPSAPDKLKEIIAQAGNRFARIHAIRALAQSNREFNQDARGNPVPAKFFADLTKDSDDEIRVQAIQALGEMNTAQGIATLIDALKDKSPRVRFFAAMILGKHQAKTAVPGILDLLRENDDKDPYLTHAGVFALTTMGDLGVIQKAAQDSSRAVKHAALLCLRKMGRSEIQQFLVLRGFDAKLDPQFTAEAARAINDGPIDDAMSIVAAWLDQDDCPTNIMRRGINANYRAGAFENAVVIANLANRTNVPEDVRLEALDALSEWEPGGKLDRVTGAWRPLTPRDAQPARDALAFVFDNLLHSESDKVVEALIRCARIANYEEAAPAVFNFFKSASNNVPARVEALEALNTFASPQLADAAKLALKDTNYVIVAAAIKFVPTINPTEGAKLLEPFLKTNVDWHLAQSALLSLGDLDSASDEILAHEMDELIAGKLRPELQLELLESAEKHSTQPVEEKLDKYRQSLPENDQMAYYRSALAGGDPVAGRKIFHDREDVACLRCHAIKGHGGIVGPDLAGVASRHPKEYLLESILFPSKQIAAGYENITVTLKNGGFYAGMVKSETPSELVLNSPEDGMVTIKKSDIQKRERGMSPMPDNLIKLLNQRDLRDLVAFLATLK